MSKNNVDNKTRFNYIDSPTIANAVETFPGRKKMECLYPV